MKSLGKKVIFTNYDILYFMKCPNSLRSLIWVDFWKLNLMVNYAVSKKKREDYVTQSWHYLVWKFFSNVKWNENSWGLISWRCLYFSVGSSIRKVECILHFTFGSIFFSIGLFLLLEPPSSPSPGLSQIEANSKWSYFW